MSSREGREERLWTLGSGLWVWIKIKGKEAGNGIAGTGGKLAGESLALSDLVMEEFMNFRYFIQGLLLR